MNYTFIEWLAKEAKDARTAARMEAIAEKLSRHDSNPLLLADALVAAESEFVSVKADIAELIEELEQSGYRTSYLDLGE